MAGPSNTWWSLENGEPSIHLRPFVTRYAEYAERTGVPVRMRWRKGATSAST